jgi:hypothetical protein
MAAGSAVVKPVRMRTSAGVEGLERSQTAYRDFVGIDGVDDVGFDAARSSAERSPSRMMTLAEWTVGRSLPVRIWTHWAAESARWSNWPGRYSTAKAVSFSPRARVGNVVDLGFGEDVGGGFVEFGVAEAVDFVALDDADGFQAGEPEGFAEVVQEVAGLGVAVGSGFFSTKMRFMDC